MRVLVACEESQAVTLACRALGVQAYSCDLEPCSGGRPDWHIRMCAVAAVRIGWDAVIAFPPCTHLASSGARWFPEKRADGRQAAAVRFFRALADAPASRVAVENPIGIMSTLWRKPDQVVHPWQFGHGEKKSTCLWLRGFPPLVPTAVVPGRAPRVHMAPDSKGRAKRRSKTYPGIAHAMAEQWFGRANRD